MSTIDPTPLDPTNKPPDGSGDVNNPVNYSSATERGWKGEAQTQFGNAKNDVEALEAGKADTTYVDAQDAATLASAEAYTDANSVPRVATADGDIIVYDGSIYLKIPVGANGQLLTARPGAGLGAKVVWEDPSAIGEANEGANLGGGTPIFLQKNGVTFEYATFTSGDGTVVINSLGNLVDLRAVLPAGVGSYNTTRLNSGPDISISRSRYNLVEGPGVSLDVIDDPGADETVITVSAPSSGEANTSSNAGGGVELALPKSVFDLPFRTLVGDSIVNIEAIGNTVDFSINDGSITGSKLSQSYTLTSTFTAHQGAGGAEHADVVAGGASGFMDGARAAKVDGIEAGAQVNTVTAFNGRTDGGDIVPASGDYTAAQVSNALGTNVARTMDSVTGVALTTRSQPSGGTFTPNPLQGHSVELTGDLDTEIGPMSQNGQINITVPEAISNVNLPAWNVTGTRPSGRPAWLWLGRNGSLLLAQWA